MYNDRKAPDISSVCVHLNIKVCPTCQAEPVAYSRPWRHAHGEFREELRFNCGCTIAWCPNYSSMEGVVPCPESPAARTKFVDKISELQDKVEQARKELHEFDQRMRRRKEMRRESRSKTPRE